MILNLSDQQSEFLEKLLFNKYKELEIIQQEALKQVQMQSKYTIYYYQKQLNETEKELDNIKSILEVLSNNKVETSNDDIQEYDRAWDDLYDDDRYEDYIDDEDVK